MLVLCKIVKRKGVLFHLLFGINCMFITGQISSLPSYITSMTLKRVIRKVGGESRALESSMSLSAKGPFLLYSISYIFIQRLKWNCKLYCIESKTVKGGLHNVQYYWFLFFVSCYGIYKRWVVTFQSVTHTGSKLVYCLFSIAKNEDA